MKERGSKYYDRTPGPYEYFQNQMSETHLELLGTQPRQFGKEQKSNSTTINAPRFSLRGRNFEKKEKQLIISDHNEVITQMAVCRHSPGVGRYDLNQEKYEKFVLTSLNAHPSGVTIPKTGRNWSTIENSSTARNSKKKIGMTHAPSQKYWNKDPSSRDILIHEEVDTEINAKMINNKKVLK